MIAEIQPSFSSHLSMSRKIEYQLSKVKEGNGKVLCTSTGDELAAMPAYMELISQLNDRVKLPYAEFILSLYPGESLSDEQWLSCRGIYREDGVRKVLLCRCPEYRQGTQPCACAADHD